MADAAEVLNLLQVANLSQQWPHLKPIHDLAMTQLQKIAAEHRPPAPSPVREPERPAMPVRRTLERP